MLGLGVLLYLRKLYRRYTNTKQSKFVAYFKQADRTKSNLQTYLGYSSELHISKKLVAIYCWMQSLYFLVTD